MFKNNNNNKKTALQFIHLFGSWGEGTERRIEQGLSSGKGKND